MLRGIHEKLYFGKDADASGGLGKGVSDFNKGVSSAYRKCIFQCFFPILQWIDFQAKKENMLKLADEQYG
jgi:hypothetical protein